MLQTDNSSGPIIKKHRHTLESQHLMVLLIVLLFIQAAGLLYIGLTIGIPQASALERLTTPQDFIGIESTLFAFLALVALFGTIRSRHSGWFLAMFLQCVTLLTALVLYFADKPGYPGIIILYIVLGYSSFMVLYLNYYRIQTFFHFDDSIQHDK